MSRPLRIEYPGAWYHVMNRGRRRDPIFYDRKDYGMFIKILAQVSKLFLAEIHAYALLPNHYHILIRTPEANISRIMRHINGVYTQKINKKYKTDGSLFRGRYKSILVEEETYLLELCRYIHRNAYKAKLEVKIGEYEWSSYKAYMGKAKKDESFVNTNHMLSKFNKYEKEARREFKAFVNKEVPKELVKTLESVRWPFMLGGEKFKKEVKKLIKGKKIDSKEVPIVRQYECGEKEKKRKEKKRDEFLRRNRELLEKKKSRKHSEARRAITYILRKRFQMSLKEIAKEFKGISYMAVSKQYVKAEKEIMKKVGCYREVKKMEKELSLK